MSFSVPEIFERIYKDVMIGQTLAFGTKQSGKSHLKKSLSAYTIQKHPETKLIIIDTEGSWEFEFNTVPFYRIINEDIKISQEIIGEKLNGNNFYRTVYKIKDTVKKDIKKLLDSKEPVLFIVELEQPEEIAYFSAYVIEYLYNKQRILRKYWKNNIKDSYLIVLEEVENIFSTHILDRKILNSLLKKINECANLNIGFLASAQRCTEVSTKFRNKSSSFLFGYVLPTDFIGLLERALRLHLGKNAKQITLPSFRHSFFYTGLNCVFKCDEFKQNGLPYEVKRTEHKTAIPRAEPVKKKKSIFQKIKDLYRFFCPQVEKHILERNLRQSRKEYFESLNPESANNHENLDVNDSEDLDFNDSEDFNSFEDFSDSEDLDSLIPFADNDEDLDESLFS